MNAAATFHADAKRVEAIADQMALSSHMGDADAWDIRASTVDLYASRLREIADDLTAAAARIRNNTATATFGEWAS